MKKIINLDLVFGLGLGLFFLLLPVVVFAQWNDCVYGKVNGSCGYPGECGSYTDSNSDKICDHSQQEPATKKKVVKDVDKEPEGLVVEGDENIILGEIGTEVSAEEKDMCLGVIEESTEDDITSDQVQEEGIVLEVKKKNAQRYPFLQITIFTTVLYLLTYILAKSRVIKMVTHKKIWNILLTISFLVMAVLSVVLIIQINSGRIFLPNFDTLYWHVITGIVMMVITVFHIGWHWRYYKNIFK